jgi:hypothetical protein
MSDVKFFFLSLFFTSLLWLPANADCGALPKAGQFISYTIEAKPADGSLSLEVSLSFRLAGIRTAELILSLRVGGAKKFV